MVPLSHLKTLLFVINLIHEKIYVYISPLLALHGNMQHSIFCKHTWPCHGA